MRGSAPETLAIMQQQARAVHQYIVSLELRDKRQLFLSMQTHPNLSHDTFFPHYGFRSGEFAVHSIIADASQETRRLKRKQRLQQTSSSVQPAAAAAASQPPQPH